MSNILRDPTKLEQAAIDALKRVGKESDIGSVRRVYGVVASEYWEAERDKELVKARNSRASTAYSPKWLQHKRITRDEYFMDEGPCLYIDHGGCYENRETKERVIINEPYQLAFEKACYLVDVCREHGLRFDVDCRSAVHFPGATLTIGIKEMTDT